MSEPMYLGFDFGLKRMGVAVGQKLTGTARPLETLAVKEGEPDWEIIKKLINVWRPEACIVGLPLRLDDKDQPITIAARRFAKQLSAFSALPTYPVDERLSTVEARALLFEQGGYRKIKKSQVDSFAASIILEQWLKCPG
ncbi:MAG: Holliday junction resolvase RuvX [Legionella sp.]|nr:Holliday junction resolvase RuvX [Legionella sp.]